MVQLRVSLSVWPFAIPQSVTRQAPLSMRFSRQEHWSGLPFPSPGDFSDSGIKLGSPTLQLDPLLSEQRNMKNFDLMIWSQSCPQGPARSWLSNQGQVSQGGLEGWPGVGWEGWVGGWKQNTKWELLDWGYQGNVGRKTEGKTVPLERVWKSPAYEWEQPPWLKGIDPSVSSGCLKMTDDARVVSSIVCDLCDTVNCSPPGFSGLGFSRPEYWSGLPFPPPVHLPNSGIEPLSFVSPALAGEFLTNSTIYTFLTS